MGQAKRIRQKIVIPIYDADLWIVVADDLPKARRKFEHLFGPVPSPDYDALCSYSGCSTYGLFFKPSALTRKIISHEIFHLTNRILEWVGSPVDKTHHEHAALLNGYLTETVCAILFKTKKPKHAKRNRQLRKPN